MTSDPKSSKAIKDSDLKAVSGGFTKKEVLISRTSPDGQAAPIKQDDQALGSVAAGGSFGKASVAGWTNPPQVRGAAGSSDNTDGKSGSSGLP